MNIIKKFLPGSAPDDQQSDSPGKPCVTTEKSLVSMRSKVLEEVLSTIEVLNEPKGSQPSAILSYILMSNKLNLTQPTQQVKHAIKTGLKAGLIKNVNGKIKLALVPKDFKTLKKFIRKDDGPSCWKKKFSRRRIKHKHKGHRWKTNHPGTT